MATGQNENEVAALEWGHRSQLVVGQLVVSQLVGEKLAAPGVMQDRRQPRDRRRLTFWSVVYGGVRPRRRRLRRIDENTLPIVDWHDPHLLAISIFVLLLSCADAFLTLTLLLHGASEANPFMARLIAADVTLFTAVKMGLTGAGILVLVLLSRYRLFGRYPVATALYSVLAGYVVLVIYELVLLTHATS
jgi:hypothetical protein